MNKKHFFTLAASLFLTAGLFAATSFSGYAGAKLNYSSNHPEQANDTTASTSKEYDPDLKLQAFFAGQFNFSQNLWSHLEFSIDTKDLLGKSLFHSTDSQFQIDELSLIMRSTMFASANYFSIYMGTYDPIGSDVFLQRYFNIKPIGSKLTESYLGLAGSILYPHFGIGVSDVVKLYDKPLAFGGYMYINHEDEDYYVFNADLRAAGMLRFLTFDIAAGIGVPLANQYRGEDVIIAVEKVYWHAGTTVLFGNNFTNSLFMQAGIYNASFTKKNNQSNISHEKIYLLVEPRLLVRGIHLNITAFSLPLDTVEKLLFLENTGTLGVDVNFYGEATTSSANQVNYGTHVSASLKEKYYDDVITLVKNPKSILSETWFINVTPYASTTFLSGELHLQATFRVLDFIQGHAEKAISVDLGYRTKF